MLDPSLLPPAQRLAASYAPPTTARKWRALLLLDTRLAGFVSQASEPILAQMRLAWWRDQLRLPVPDRASGDPLLAAIGRDFTGQDAALISLVEGWERLVADAPLTDGAIDEFAKGRAAAICSIADEDAINPARVWALADLAAHTSDPNEKERVLVSAAGYPARPDKLSREMRPLAVLTALSLRSIKRNGAPFLSNRLSVLLAIRVGLFGR